MEKAIEISNLVKRYGEKRGVSGVTFSVDKGDFFGFIGPNGAGKSTTIRSMMGLIKMTSGSIRILGMDAAKENVKIRRQVGYMPSETMFYPKMKVSEIIEMTAKAYHMDCKKRAEELCKRLKVDTTKRIEELSLGNRKKVSIVCTMQHEPKLYLFDEPTSGLDPLIQKEFFELLGEANKKGATIFFSSHVLSEIQSYCNKAAIIKEGRLLACDTIEQLVDTTARRVILRGCGRMPEIAGMTDLYQDSNMTSFLYKGSSQSLLQALLPLNAQDVLIEEPSLEEIVLHFYGEGKEL